MKNLRSLIWKAAVIGSLTLGASPAGAVGSTSASPAGQTQTALVTELQVEQQLAAVLAAHKNTANFKYKGDTSKFEALLDAALMKALDKSPYMRYILDRYQYAWKGSSALVNVTVSFTYRETTEQTAYVDQRVKGILGTIITPAMTSDEKVKAIHDWIVGDLKYDESLRNYTAYSGLTTGEAVCQGYTLLAYKLLSGAGIKSLIAEGTANGQPHAWNLVSLGGRWYHLDTTWDDPVGQKAGAPISYDYYLLSDSEIKKDHSWTKAYPAAGVTYRTALSGLKRSDPAHAAVYRALEQELGYTLYEEGQSVSGSAGLITKAKEAIKAGKSEATVRYSGQETQLVKDLGKLYTLNIQNITYYAEPLNGTKDLKVTIAWQN
ncbi:transglutaminase domain-containing protein [Paenibacillus pinistramenti]|uniref:transglutaminase domain-containing protein n=1 Tax=Paenibacillus pinistramenti TaxID=1768003 RepID=UPI001107DD8D|nr:transglutaminase domain-containing protein [Paenibacillus pinistramenti]